MAELLGGGADVRTVAGRVGQGTMLPGEEVPTIGDLPRPVVAPSALPTAPSRG
ncbi:hypothetical protein [Streptomyces sp. NPDC051219]|uniref:hypothetical protein n=1 Tax=Streptomyces sp. NPDC051219 TaxID=3155283 RepID=UPI003438149A